MPFQKGKSGNPNGRAKGRKNNSTLEKEALRQQLMAKVAKAMDPMTDAQIANAQGLKFLVLREKRSGKFIKRITDMEGEIKLDPEREIVEVWAKDPCVQAFTDLMNRTLDKPKEQPVAVDLTVNSLDERIRAARARAGRA